MATHAHRSPRIGRILIGLAVLWGMIGLAGVESWAADTEDTRATLRGLRGVGVLVEPLDPDVERAGLTTLQLQTAVEGQLRKAGIPLFTTEERGSVPSHPFVSIQVHVLLRSYALVAYFTQVALHQRASLDTDASLATVSTWQVGLQGTIEKVHLDTLDDSVREAVDHFINAYFGVHPRPAGRAAPATASPRP